MNEPVAAPPSASEDPARPKTQAAEAFAQLTRSVDLTRADVRQIADFVRQAAPNATQAVDAARREGSKEGIDALVTVHQAVFDLIAARRTQADGGQGEMLELLASVRSAVESQLDRFGISVREPGLGDDGDPAWMEIPSSQRIDEGSDHVPGTVAAVRRCAYIAAGADGARLLEKALVSVFATDEYPADGS